MAASVVMVVGLGFGDEGKGGVVDYFTRQTKATLTVRFNGGAQAAHNVIDDTGRHHTFAQFGSGTFAGARTFLSRFMIFNPLTALAEAAHLQQVGVSDPFSMLTVEDGSLITTPFHMAANRLREILRSQGRHGSCGMGIGETVSHKLYHPEEAIYARDLPLCRGKLRALRQRLVDELARPMVGLMKDTNAYQATGAAREWEMLNDNDFVGEIVQKFASLAQKIDIVEESWLPKQLARKTTVVFEGAQGVLLDQDYGWAPHTTWSNCTFENALQLVHGTHAQVTRIGVLRGYMTRHGAGPFVTEDPIWKPPAGEHNSTGPWQHAFRLGPFDPIAARYALQVAGPVDHLALTCLDHLKGEIRSCTRYTTAQGSVLLSEIHVDRPRRIEPFDADHQRRQEEKAKLLSILKPTYTTLPDVESFLAHVEAEMQTPIKLCSFGPKASDKRPR